MRDYLCIYGGKSNLYTPVKTEGMDGLTNGEVHPYFTKTGSASIEVITEYLRNTFKKEPEGDFKRNIVYLSTEMTIDEVISRIWDIRKRRDFLKSSTTISILQNKKPNISYRYFLDSLKRAMSTDLTGMVIIDSFRNCTGTQMPFGYTPDDYTPNLYKNLCITAERLNVPIVTISLVRPDYIDQISSMIKTSTLRIRNERNICRVK